MDLLLEEIDRYWETCFFFTLCRVWTLPSHGGRQISFPSGIGFHTRVHVSLGYRGMAEWFIGFTSQENSYGMVCGAIPSAVEPSYNTY